MSFSYFRDKPNKNTEFTQYSDDFYLNADGVLCLKELPKDDQAVIDSYYSTRLEAILDLYSEQFNAAQGYNVIFDENTVDVDTTRSDLEHMLKVNQLVDEFKASNPDVANYSMEDTLSYLKQKYNDALSKAKGVGSNAEKKETVPESKQETVHEDGNQSEQ